MSVLRATDVQFRGASPARAKRSAWEYGLCVTGDRPRMTGELRLRLCWIAHKEQIDSTGNEGARTETPAELAEAEAGEG